MWFCSEFHFSVCAMRWQLQSGTDPWRRQLCFVVQGSWVHRRQKPSLQGGKKPGLYTLPSIFPMDGNHFICWLFTKCNGYSRRSDRNKNKMRAMAIYYFRLLIFISWNLRWLWKQLLLCTHWICLILSINYISVTWVFLPLIEFFFWLLSSHTSFHPFSAQSIFCLEVQRPQQLL